MMTVTPGSSSSPVSSSAPAMSLCLGPSPPSLTSLVPLLSTSSAWITPGNPCTGLIMINFLTGTSLMLLSWQQSAATNDAVFSVPLQVLANLPAVLQWGSSGQSARPTWDAQDRIFSVCRACFCAAVHAWPSSKSRIPLAAR